MNSPTTIKILTVSELTGKIKDHLENTYRFIRIIGEISNLKTSFAGHTYFTLKDNSAQLQSVLFKQQKRFVDTPIADGQKVICFGKITVYEPRGNYQLIVDSIEPAGAGKIQLEFERTKAKLAARGYFDESRKKVIPKFPRKIAVISSPTGAAFADFLKIIRLRQANVHIQLYPVSVQGEQSPKEIVAAIKELDRLQQHDVVAIIRGGGSLEDLQAFNNEHVAEAIVSARLPVITGIGHQVDFTIADFCADYRCPTPTAAAEYLANDSKILQQQLVIFRRRLYAKMQHKLESAKQRLRYHHRSLKEITRQFDTAEHALTLQRNRMEAALIKQISSAEKKLNNQAYLLHLRSPQQKISTGKNKLVSLQQRLEQSIEQILDNNTNKLEKTAALLHGVSPLATLARGYSVTRKTDEKNPTIISKADEVSPGEHIEILLHQGKLECMVEKSHPPLTSTAPVRRKNS